MIKEIRSLRSLSKSSSNLRVEIPKLSLRMLLPYSTPVQRSGRESSTRLTSMSGSRLVITSSRKQMLASPSLLRSTRTWSKEKTTPRSKAYKLTKLQSFFRPNLRPSSLGQLTSKSTPMLHSSIWKSRTTSRASKICWSPSSSASKTSEPTLIICPVRS